MSASSENPHSEAFVQFIPEVIERSFIAGNVLETVSDPINVFTLKPSAGNFEDMEGTVIVLENNPYGDEAWILPSEQNKLNVVDRIRFMEGGSIEFLHFNGTEDPLRARYSRVDGALDFASLVLSPEMDVSVPSQISSAAIEELKTIFGALKKPEHNAYSFSGLAVFAKSQEILDIFRPVPASS